MKAGLFSSGRRLAKRRSPLSLKTYAKLQMLFLAFGVSLGNFTKHIHHGMILIGSWHHFKNRLVSLPLLS
jgi:hypothetical protein